ncbi:MAG: putative manganese-dependent inorganic diphosphatase [Treponema sp.]|nr:putative manganese-dependent inorganic diphosphatase [Treponema sp.]
MDRTVYVIGHKNPDTDSVVAATAYAELKRSLGMPEARAARAGAANPQTEYIFQRFGVHLPEFVPDLIPKVEHWLGDPVPTVLETSPLWEALALMGKAENRVLPIVDAEGRYKALLHYGAFAENILAKINPHKKAVITTSIAHLVATAKAQPLVIFDEHSFFKARMLVAALETESFVRHLKSEPVDTTIILVGDREDVQRISIESGVRALVVTNGNVVSKAIRELAEQKRVSILVSPYDTSSTSLLVLYSTPVGTMGDASIQPLQKKDWLKTARKALAASPSRSVPVVDEDGRVVGIFAEGDLAREPHVDIILVDHNELTQAVEGAENYRVLEVIDHHRLGTFSTRYPINFINRTVGSTSTIIASMYREARVPLPKKIASILLCGILSDTLVLRSATTTEVDRDMAEYLSNITDLDVDAVGTDIMGAASAVASKPAADIVNLDLKEYETSGKKICVSQVEVTDTAVIMDRKAEILGALAKVRAERQCWLAALMVTDITELTSLLFIDGEKEIYSQVNYPRSEEGVYVLKDILSRKKQLMPAMFELVERTLEV